MKRLLFSLLGAAALLPASGAQPSGSLPVIYITTENNQEITSKEDYVKASYYLDPNGCEGVSAFGSKDAPLDLQIRGRGNYTWTGFDKKPYRLKLGKKQKLMGMSSSKHWALLAHADDNKGFLRNAVGFQLSRLAGLPWTPGDAPVEVVLNGDYIGLYFLTETVRVDEKRVNVFDYDSAVEDYEEANPGQTLPWQDDYATGGWLVEIDNYEDPAQIEFESIDPYVPDPVMRVTYDTPSDYITDAHKEWLLKEFRQLDEMIINGDTDECAWQQKIDMTNLARFFVVNQLVFNYESFHGSCKLSRDMGADAKWNFGPVWDFGSAFQTTEDTLLFDYGLYSNHWIKALYQYPAFVKEVERVYATLMDGDYDTIYGYIDTFIDTIEEAARADKERWPQYGNENLNDRAGEVKGMLRSSVNYLNRIWHYASATDDQYTVYFIDFDNAWDDVYVFTWNPVACGEWPGTQMQRVDPSEIYADPNAAVWKYTFTESAGLPEAGHSGIIFNNGQSGVEDGNQTIDLIYEHGGIYDRGGITTGITAPDAADELPVEYYDLSGRRIDSPAASGIYIRRQGAEVRKVVVNRR